MPDLGDGAAQQSKHATRRLVAWYSPVDAITSPLWRWRTSLQGLPGRSPVTRADRAQVALIGRALGNLFLGPYAVYFALQAPGSGGESSAPIGVGWRRFRRQRPARRSIPGRRRTR
jgi:hypothetical protein